MISTGASSEQDAAEAHYVSWADWPPSCCSSVRRRTVYLLDTAKDAFDIILQVGAGTGLLYLVRWFWWRVNAWCEVAAMASSFLVSIGFLAMARAGSPVSTHIALVLTVAITTICWVVTAFVTPPTDRDVLIEFYRKVRRSVRAGNRFGTSSASMPMRMPLATASRSGCSAGRRAAR